VSGVSVPHRSLLAKIEEDSPSMSGVSVGDSGISAKNKARDTIPSGMSVPHSSLLAKIEEDSPSMSGLSVVNPRFCEQNFNVAI